MSAPTFHVLDLGLRHCDGRETWRLIVEAADGRAATIDMPYAGRSVERANLEVRAALRDLQRDPVDACRWEDDGGAA